MAFQTIQAPPPLRLSDEEYEHWLEGEGNRGELVDYWLEEHDPVSLTHVSIAEFLTRLLGVYLEVRPVGRSLVPPYPMRFRAGFRRLPDLLFVSTAHSARLRPTYIDGAVDAVWEIVSPDSIERDWSRKFAEYQEQGIPEYWIIDPLSERAALYLLGPNGYTERPEEDGKLVYSVIDGFWIRTDWLWQDPRPASLRCLREMGVLP